MSVDEEASHHPVYTITMLSTCVVAVALNILVIAVIGKVGRFRTSVEIFLTNLAASDILQAGVVMPIHFKNLSVQEEDFYGGDFLCKLVKFVPMFSVMSSISTIIAIAADRYRVMVRRRLLARCGALVAVGITWLISFCVSAPQLYEYNIYYIPHSETNQTQKTCGSEGIVENFSTIYTSFVLVLAFCVPFLVLTVCYVRISIFVRSHTRRFMLSRSQKSENTTTTSTNSCGPLDSLVSARNAKVLKMSMAITVAFGLLWTPFFILFAVQEITDLDHITELAKWPHLITRTMTILSTITNPTLYLTFSRPFRKALFKVCTCAWKNPERVPSSTENTIYAPNFTSCACCQRSRRRIKPETAPDTALSSTTSRTK